MLLRGAVCNAPENPMEMEVLYIGKPGAEEATGSVGEQLSKLRERASKFVSSEAFAIPQSTGLRNRAATESAR